MNFPERAITKSVCSFVSEKDIEEQRQTRQAEWEKSRKPDDPLEAPEVVYDHRTLYDRLQEQKNKKQEDYEETHKLKNMIRGLDNDELSFLEQIDKNKMDEAEKKHKEESDAMDEYQKAMTDLTDEEQVKKITDFKKSTLWSASKMPETNKKPSSSKRSQLALLANVIKRKSDCSQISELEPVPKKAAVETVKIVGALPGLGCYGSDSEDSNNSNSSANRDEGDEQALPTVVGSDQSSCSKK